VNIEISPRKKRDLFFQGKELRAVPKRIAWARPKTLQREGKKPVKSTCYNPIQTE